MTLKTRILRIAAMLFLVSMFAGYFAFSTFLFRPFERDFAADVATLIPRDVDFFAAKAGLREDFKPFPRLASAERIESTLAWQALRDTPEHLALRQKLGLDAALEQAAELREELRGMDALEILGGRDVAVAGYFRSGELALSDFAVYARANWIGKLGVELLNYPRLIGLEQRGMVAAVEDDHVALSGGNLAREFYLTRMRDVIVVATSVELVQQSLELYARGGQDSFGQSARYFDHIQNVERSSDRSELEFFVDTRSLSENLRISGRWPNPDAQDLLPAFAGHLFQFGSLNELVAVLGFRRGIALDLWAGLSSELITAEQKRIYRTRGFERDQFIGQGAALAPDDASWFVFLQADLGEILRQALAALEPAVRELIDDPIRATKEFGGAADFIAALEEIFKDRIAVIARPNDYQYRDDDPPNNDAVVPAIAVCLWPDGGEKQRLPIEALHRLVAKYQANFGLRGANPGEKGVFESRIAGGHAIWEFWNPLLPGTGHVAAVNAGDLYILSNTYALLGPVLRTYYQGAPDYPRLSERPDFRELVSTGPAEANLGVWVNPRSLSAILRAQVPQAAEDLVLDNVDWESERALVEQEVLRGRFNKPRREQLSPEENQKFEELVQAELLERKRRLRDEQIPAQRARLERHILYSETVSALLGMLSLDPKEIKLALRATVPLDR